MKQMTLMQHFSELRRRVLWVALIFALCFVFGWWIAPFLQQFLTQPLMAVWPDGELLYTGLSDGLMIHFSLATLFLELKTQILKEILKEIGRAHV